MVPVWLLATRLAFLAIGAASAVTPAASAQALDRADPPRTDPPLSPSSETRRTEGRVLIYFPPQPPRLWAPLPAASIVPGRNPAPPAMVEHVAEPFYAPLATRLRSESLTPALREQLEAHRAEASALREELRATLAAVSESDSVTRERVLSDLASAQAARLGALEARAEQLREELIRGRDHWGALREWRLGSTRFPTSAVAMSAQYQVLRAAAYYQKGLSPAQRRLLREIVLDMENLTDLPLMGNELAADTNPLLSFSPETSRLWLPSPLTSEVAELIAVYERGKAELKQELRDAVCEEDSTFLWFMRNGRLENLARAQQPRFEALEILAERIRKTLAAARYRPIAPPVPSFPPAVVERIDRYIEYQKEMQDEIARTISSLQNLASLERINVAPTENGRFEVRIALRPGPRHDEQMERVKAHLEAFNHAHASRIGELNAELAAIRQAVVWLEGEGGETDAQAQRDAARAVEAYFTALENRRRLEKYREYEIAVLEPGLSPAQRRLLFAAAVASLELPLPSGSPQPTRIESVARPRPAPLPRAQPERWERLIPTL